MTSQAQAEQVEQLSRKFHAIYQEEAFRQSQTGEDTVRHPDNYDALPEHTKEYDRVLARYVLDQLTAAEARVWEAAADFVKGDRNNPPESEYDYGLFSLEKEFRRRAT